MGPIGDRDQPCSWGERRLRVMVEPRAEAPAPAQQVRRFSLAERDGAVQPSRSDRTDSDLLLDAAARGRDDASVGYRYEVGGVLSDRPFKVRRLGHVGLNVANAAESLAFYGDLLGFRVSDPMDFRDVVPPEVLPALEGLAE